MLKAGLASAARLTAGQLGTAGESSALMPSTGRPRGVDQPLLRLLLHKHTFPPWVRFMFKSKKLPGG